MPHLFFKVHSVAGNCLLHINTDVITVKLPFQAKTVCPEESHMMAFIF